MPANFLLLDEPTNHLDMRAKDVLLKALEEYTGTVVFVSHDRYFIDKLATRVFEIGDGKVEVFPGKLRGLSLAKGRRTTCLPTLDDVPGASRPKVESAPPQSNGNGATALPRTIEKAAESPQA